MWAAKRVLETQRRPRRIQHYHLFELHSERFKQLEKLKAEQPTDLERTIDLYEGDFNTRFREILRPGVIKDSEATFCLLDQRTFECHWSTVKALAEHKSGRKIEIFYFLAMKWLARSLKGITRNTSVLENWWGRSDWDQLREMSSLRCAEEIVKRFKEELGYASVKKWPIFRTKSPGNVMYFMIHATDHDQAPILMRRAYEKAVTPVHTEQLSFLSNFDDYLLTGGPRL
jgi:three-Cys-motif partner protein